jgi:hypothetical protein
MSSKFIRGLYFNFVGVPLATNSAANLVTLKLIYEFWGFCSNGGNSLTLPGGFATISGSLAPNYLSMPAGFESGSTTLLASGSDGSTSLGSPIFTAPSVNWTSGSYTGKFLVTWRSGSTSTDDSVYLITQILNTSSILVDPTTGGTPYAPANNLPSFTTRTGINYRVIDLVAAGNLGWTTPGSYMILQFNGSYVNVGQANSQCMMKSYSGFTNNGGTVGFTLSASGSWNGTAFTDSTQVQMPDCANSTADWFYNQNNYGDNYFVLSSDPASLLMLVAGTTVNPYSGVSSFFHIEVPARLFPYNVDPNPICSTNNAQTSFQQSQIPSGLGFASGMGSGWLLHDPFDLVNYVRHLVLAKNIAGESSSFANNQHTITVVTDYNVNSNKQILLDMILAHNQSRTEFTMGRVQLRRAMLTAVPMSNVKFGSNGEWISMTGGWLWPWDNSTLHRPLIPINF